MRVTHTRSDLASAGLGSLAATPAAEPAAKSSFAAKLASTVGTVGTNAAAETGTDTKTKDQDKAGKAERALPKGPKGETTREVKDHPYLEVMSGPRNGMFINTTNNERRGQAFVLVERGNHDLHIYGTGKNRRVIISWHKDQPAHAGDDAKSSPAKDTTETTPATGGATAP